MDTSQTVRRDSRGVGRLSFHSQQWDIAAATQLLHQEGGKGEGWAAVAEVIQEVQVLHQGKAVDQVAAGKVWQLGSLCGRRISRQKFL